eukprot:748481_1
MSILMQSPMVEHHPLDKGFTILNVPFEDLEVVAPTLKFQGMEAGPTKFLVAYQATDKHRVKVKARGKVIDRFWVTKSAVPEYGAQMANIQPGLIGDCYGETNPTPTGTGSSTGRKSSTGSVEPGAGAEEKKEEAELKKRMNALAGKLGRAKTIEDITSHTQECNTLEAALDKALSENPNSAEVKRLKKEFEVAVMKVWVDIGIATAPHDADSNKIAKLKRIKLLLDQGKNGG